MSVLSAILAGWKGRNDFLKAQAFVAGILVLAYVGNTWPRSYDRNLNKDPTMFWLANLGLFLAAMASWKHDPSSSSRGVQLLSRAQTEEWKGWMQWAFIMVSSSAQNAKKCQRKVRYMYQHFHRPAFVGKMIPTALGHVLSLFMGCPVLSLFLAELG